jgi:hypothetical protein
MMEETSVCDLLLCVYPWGYIVVVTDDLGFVLKTCESFWDIE